MATQPRRHGVVRELPVPIVKAPPSAPITEWQLARWLINGGQLTSDAVAAMLAVGLTPEQFTVPELRPLVAQVLAMAERDEQINETTLPLGVTDASERDGLYMVLNRLSDQIIVSGDPVAQALRIRDLAVLRKARSAAHNLAVAANRPDVTPGELAELAETFAIRLRREDASVTTEAPRTRWQPDIQRLPDLMAKDLPTTIHYVAGLIPEGLDLFGAKAKKGKTTLMMYLCASISLGTHAMGALLTRRCEVLYLALEDNERRVQKRMRKMLGADTPPDGFTIAYHWPALDQGGLEALATYLNEHTAVGVIVIDTLEHVRPERRNGGGYADDYASVRGLQQLAGERQVAIVALTHLRKAPAEDPVDELNASMGLAAAVDNIIVMRPAPGGAKYMEIHRRGREFDDDDTLAIEGSRDTLTWKYLGKAEEIGRSEQRRQIVALLKKHPTGMYPKDIAQALDKNASTVRVLLSKLLEENKPVIQRDADGYYTAIE